MFVIFTLSRSPGIDAPNNVSWRVYRRSLWSNDGLSKLICSFDWVRRERCRNRKIRSKADRRYFNMTLANAILYYYHLKPALPACADHSNPNPIRYKCVQLILHLPSVIVQIHALVPRKLLACPQQSLSSRASRCAS